MQCAGLQILKTPKNTHEPVFYNVGEQVQRGGRVHHTRQACRPCNGLQDSPDCDSLWPQQPFLSTDTRQVLDRCTLATEH